MDNIKIIKVFEDRQKKLILSEQEEKDILSMKSIIGENNINLQTDGRLLISHYVGFIQINRTRLLIYPKIASRSKQENDYERAFDILIKLLSNSKFVNIKRIPSPQALGKYNGDILELFISFFADEILYLLKRDVNRCYNTNLENQSFIKGKIDFAETVKHNNFRKHLHYVHYDQFTENILLNQIFKTVILNLIIRTTVRENKMKLKQALLWLEDVEPVSLNNEIWNKVKFSALNSAYESVFNLAKLFYFNSNPNLNKGDELTFSFLVPLNQLFERYLYEAINNNSGCYTVKYQGPIDYLAKLNESNIMQLRPDITIIDDGKIKYIIDAKYKEVLNSENELQVSQSDIYQMLAYSIRYQCNNIALVYPKFLGIVNNEIVVSEISIDIYYGKVRIKILQIDLEESKKVLGEILSKIFM